MSKKLCKKDEGKIKKDSSKESKFECKSCGLRSNKEKHLCKSKKIK